MIEKIKSVSYKLNQIYSHLESEANLYGSLSQISNHHDLETLNLGIDIEMLNSGDASDTLGATNEEYYTLKVKMHIEVRIELDDEDVKVVNFWHFKLDLPFGRRPGLAFLVRPISHKREGGKLYKYVKTQGYKCKKTQILKP